MADRKASTLWLDKKSFAVLLGYIALVCVGVSHYLAGEDEGRAWIVARDFGIYRMLFRILRYEGHPPLWYFVLWPLAHLHMNFVHINWISAAFGIAGIYVLLRYCPLPFYLRALLPFGFALGFQYAVVARSYCLFPLVGFFVAHQFRQTRRDPVTFAIALAILANISVHAVLVGLGFAVAYAWDLRRQCHAEGTRLRNHQQARLAAGILTTCLIFVVFVLWPPKGMHPPLGPTMIKVYNTLSRVSNPAPARPHIQPTLHRIALVAPATKPVAVESTTAGLPLPQRLHYTFVDSVAGSIPLALLLYALLVTYLIRQQQALLILPILFVQGFLVVVYVTPWHIFLVWITILLALWAAWKPAEPATQLTLQNTLAAYIGLLCLIHISWTAHAIHYEWSHPTYPAVTAANYLKTFPPGTRIDGYDHAFTLLPYFDPTPFHFEDRALEDISAAIADDPAVIVLRQSSIPDDQMDQLTDAGYRTTQHFCGSAYFPNQAMGSTCLLTLEKTP